MIQDFYVVYRLKKSINLVLFSYTTLGTGEVREGGGGLLVKDKAEILSLQVSASFCYFRTRALYQKKENYPNTQKKINHLGHMYTCYKTNISRERENIKIQTLESSISEGETGGLSVREPPFKGPLL